MNVIPVRVSNYEKNPRYEYHYSDWGLLIESDLRPAKENIFIQKATPSSEPGEPSVGGKGWLDVFIANGHITNLTIDTRNQLITTSQGIYSTKQGISHPVIKNLEILITLQDLPSTKTEKKNFFDSLKAQFTNLLPKNQKLKPIYTAEQTAAFSNLRDRVINELKAERFIMDVRHLGGTRYCSIAGSIDIKIADISCMITIPELHILTDEITVPKIILVKKLSKWESFSQTLGTSKAWLDAGFAAANLTLSVIEDVGQSVNQVAGVIGGYANRINNLVARSINIATPINSLVNSINTLKNSIKTIKEIPSNISNSFVDAFENLANLFDASNNDSTALNATDRKSLALAKKTGILELVSFKALTSISTSANLFSIVPDIQVAQEGITLSSLVAQTGFVMAASTELEYSTKSDLIFLERLTTNITIVIDGLRVGQIFLNLDEYSKPVYKDIISTDYLSIMPFYESLYADFIDFVFTTKRNFLGLKSKKYIRGTTLEMVAQDLYKRPLDEEIYQSLHAINQFQNSFEMPETIFYDDL